MNLRHVEFVVAAASECSFSRAAERCHVTQPTLSNGIAQLEAEVGGQLFVRTTRKVELSPFGQQMLPLIDALSRAHGELKAGVRSFYDPAHRMIRIGLSPLVDARRVAEVLEPYERINPGCKTFFKEYFLGDLEERLQGAQLDIVIRSRLDGGASPKSLVRVPFYVEDLYFLPRHGPAAAVPAEGAATIKEISGETFVLGPEGCGLAAITRGLFKKVGARLKEYSGHAGVGRYRHRRDDPAGVQARAALPRTRTAHHGAAQAARRRGVRGGLDSERGPPQACRPDAYPLSRACPQARRGQLPALSPGWREADPTRFHHALASISLWCVPRSRRIRPSRDRSPCRPCGPIRAAIDALDPRPSVGARATTR